MRVTQTEKPFSILQIKHSQVMISNQNDPNVGNSSINSIFKKGNYEATDHEKQNKKILKLKKEFLKKIEQIESRHKQQIVRLEKKHKQQRQNLTAKFNLQITEKQQYIHTLEEMINNGDSMLKTKPKNIVDQSKYVYTEHPRNYVPHYEDISDQIDFKIQPRMSEKQFSLDNKAMGKKVKDIMQSCSTHDYMKSNSSGKHTLNPKSKPSDHNIEDLISYKLSEYVGQKSGKSLRPFFY